MTAGKPTLPVMLWNIVSINAGWFACVLGAVGGPMAYFGGIQFGGLLAPAGITVFIGAVALQWAIATPLVVAGAARIGRWAGQPVPAEAAEVYR